MGNTEEVRPAEIIKLPDALDALMRVYADLAEGGFFGGEAA